MCNNNTTMTKYRKVTSKNGKVYYRPTPEQERKKAKKAYDTTGYREDKLRNSFLSRARAGAKPHKLRPA